MTLPLSPMACGHKGKKDGKEFGGVCSGGGWKGMFSSHLAGRFRSNPQEFHHHRHVATCLGARERDHGSHISWESQKGRGEGRGWQADDGGRKG